MLLSEQAPREFFLKSVSEMFPGHKRFKNPVLVYTDCMKNTAHKKSNECLGDHSFLAVVIRGNV